LGRNNILHGGEGKQPVVESKLHLAGIIHKQSSCGILPQLGKCGKMPLQLLAF
jgi:hypothetical protein